MTFSGLHKLAALYQALADSARRTIMWLIVTMMVLMFVALWLLSEFNLDYAQKALSEIREQQISESFGRGFERISQRQTALQLSTTALAQTAQSFYSLALHEKTGLDHSQIETALKSTLTNHIKNLDGALAAGILFEQTPQRPQRFAIAVMLTENQQISIINNQAFIEKKTAVFGEALQHTAADATDKIIWTPVYFDSETDKAVISLLSPIINNDGKQLGWVIIDWDANKAIELISTVDITADSFSFLLDQNNRNLSSLVHNKDELLAQNTLDSIKTLDLVHFSATSRSNKVNRTYMVSNQRSYELLFANTPAGMVFGVGVPKDEIDAVLIPLRNSNLIAVSTTLLILFITCFLLIQKIYRLMLDLKTAYTDSLTGLPNRSQLLLDLNKTTNNGLILINIDRFKEANALFGQQCGDQLLEVFAQKLQTEISHHSDNTFKLYRLPGDEFVLLGHINDEAAIDGVMASLHQDLNNLSISCTEQQLEIDFTCAGVFRHAPTHERSIDSALTQAKIALLQARKKGERYRLYNEKQSPENQYQENLYWAKQLRLALDEDRIVPYFQPIQDNHSGEINKFECLIRMLNTDGQPVSPGLFLDVAQKLRLDRQLTQLMVDKSFAFFAGSHYQFSINLSYLDVLDPGVVNHILQRLEQYPVGKQVIFEILESDGIENYNEVLAFIGRVKAYGARIAVDDFGTGYSNFEQLLRLNVDIIKIDGSLIKTLDQDETARKVTAGIVEFAHRLNLQVVAEFVHSASVLAEVKKLGIDFSQGYFIGAPDAQASLRK